MGDAEIGCRYPVGRDMTGGGMPGATETRSEPPTAGARPILRRERSAQCRAGGPGASLGVLGEYGLPRRADAVAWHAPRLPLVKLGLHGAHPPALRW